MRTAPPAAPALPASAAPPAPPVPLGVVGRVRTFLFGKQNGNGQVKTAPTPAAPLPGGLGEHSEIHFVGPDTGNIIRIALQGTPYPDAERLTREMAFITSAYCFAAMRWRATRLAEPPLMVVQETEEGEAWQPDHRLADLLDAPRPDVDMGELLQITQQYRDGTGSCLWWVQKNVLGAEALVTPFAATEYRVSAVPPRIYGQYEVKVAGGSWRPVPLEECIHFRDPGLGGWHKHQSLVDIALAQLDLGHQVNRIIRRYLDRAMFPGGVISPDKNWHPTPQEWALWKEAVEAWYGGPSNAGAPLALPGGTTAARLSSGLQDLLPEPVLDRVEATVGSVFGVPPIVLGWLSGMKNSPWSQMAAARRAAYEETIEPLWRDVERRLTRALMTPEERHAGFKCGFDTLKVKAVQEDAERRSRIAKLNADAWTVNERRIFAGQEPLKDDDERGDLITGLIPKDSAYSRATGAAVDAAPGVGTGGDKAAAAPAGEGTTLQTLVFPKAKWKDRAEAVAWASAHHFKTDVDETSDSWRLRQRDPGAFVAGSFRTICLMGASGAGDAKCRVKAVIGKLKTGKAAVADATKAQLRDLAWLVFDVQTKAAVPEWEAAVAGYLAQLRERVVALAHRTLRAHKSEAKQVDPDSAAELKRQVNAMLRGERRPLAAFVRPLVVSTGRDALGQVATALNLSFATVEPGLATYADEEAAFLADVMGEETGRAVAATVQRGLLAGDDIGDLVKRLQAEAAFSRTRAKLTARTETTRAWNGAQRRSLSDFQEASGRQVMKSWLSARDDRVREEHQDLDDGSFIAVDEAFDNGLDEPGEPNCRCTLIYSVEPAGGEGEGEGEPTDVGGDNQDNEEAV